MGFGAIHQAPCPVPKARLPAVIRSWSSTISSPMIREQSECPAKMMRNWSLIIMCQIVIEVLICVDMFWSFKIFWGAFWITSPTLPSPPFTTLYQWPACPMASSTDGTLPATSAGCALLELLWSLRTEGIVTTATGESPGAKALTVTGRSSPSQGKKLRCRAK